MGGYTTSSEGHKVGNAADFGIGVGVGPCRLTSVANRIIVAEPFVGTERLKLYRCEGGLVDVITRDIPAWSEPGFVKAQWMPGIRNDAVVVADHEVTRTLSNIYAMVWVGSMTQDSFVFFIEGIHGAPCERQSSLEFCCMGREVRVCHAPLAATCCSPTRTVYHEVDPRSGCWVICSVRSNTCAEMSDSGK